MSETRATCPKCRCDVPVAEGGTFKLHGRYIIGSKHGFYRCAKSGMRVDGRRRTRLGHQIQNAIAKGETKLPADPFAGFRETTVREAVAVVRALESRPLVLGKEGK